MRKIILHLYRYFFAHTWAQKINYLLHDCAMRGLGVLNYESEHVSGERFLMRDILPKYIGSDTTFFDIGANIGHYSSALALLYPKAEIYAFEPNPHSFAKLKALASSRIRCVNMGLSDKAEALDLFDRSDESGSEHASLYGDVITEIHGVSARKVEIVLTTLDAFCLKENIQRIDLLKIDTEGHELKVAMGATRMIGENRIGLIQVEFNEMNRISRCFYHDLITVFPNHVFYRLLPNGLLPIPAQPIYQEIFAFQNLIGLPKRIGARS